MAHLCCQICPCLASFKLICRYIAKSSFFLSWLTSQMFPLLAALLDDLVFFTLRNLRQLVISTVPSTSTWSIWLTTPTCQRWTFLINFHCVNFGIQYSICDVMKVIPLMQCWTKPPQVYRAYHMLCEQNWYPLFIEIRRCGCCCCCCHRLANSKENNNAKMEDLPIVFNQMKEYIMCECVIWKEVESKSNWNLLICWLTKKPQRRHFETKRTKEFFIN